MIGTVKLYRVRGSLSSGEYPLMTGEETPVATFTDVKWAAGLQTQIELPQFTQWELCNVARLEVPGSPMLPEYYWIAAYRERTASSLSVTLTLDLMGPTTFFRAGDRVTGSWHKLPTVTAPGLRQSVSSQIMEISESIYMDSLDCPKGSDSLDYITLWVQVTLTDSSGPANRLRTYGCFVAYDPNTRNMLEDFHIYYDETRTYPNLYDLIVRPETVIGVPAEQIIDISISRRCPYRTLRTPSQYGTFYYVRLRTTTPSAHGTSDALMYWTSLDKPSRENWSRTLTLSDMVRECGEITVRDSHTNAVMTIPTTRGNPRINAHIDSDINGMYLAISCQDQTIRIPEGHLPYIGSNWATYKTYQMDTDRMILDNAVNAARMTRETQQISGAVNGAINGVQTGIMTGILGGGPAAAVTGIGAGVASTLTGLWEADRGYELSVMQADFARRLSERQAVLGPEPCYSTGYGLINIVQQAETPVRICVSLPRGLTQSYYDNWIERYGHPTEGIRTVEIGLGFYQGQLRSTGVSWTAPKSGVRWDRCNETFMKGFTFVEP